MANPIDATAPMAETTDSVGDPSEAWPWEGLEATAWLVLDHPEACFLTDWAPSTRHIRGSCHTFGHIDQATVAVGQEHSPTK
jgi:hypothetical protein